MFGLDGVNYYQVIPLYFILYFVYLQILGFFFILLNSENISHKCPPQWNYRRKELTACVRQMLDQMKKYLCLG